MSDDEGKIKGGYYIKAKKIQKSAIAHTPPHVREIWDWLLREVNWKDTDVCKRGEIFTSFKEIQDGLHWMVGWRKETYSKSDCEKAMNFLRKETMIETEKTTRGLFIRVLNYDKYQTFENYEKYNESNKKATRKQQTADTIQKELQVIEGMKEENTITATSAEEVKKEKKPEASLDWVRNIQPNEISEIAEALQVEERLVRTIASDLIDYCESKNKRYANYKSELRVFIKRHLKDHPEAIRKKPSQEDIQAQEAMKRERTPEEQAALEAKLNAMRASLKDKFSMVK